MSSPASDAGSRGTPASVPPRASAHAKRVAHDHRTGQGLGLVLWVGIFLGSVVVLVGVLHGVVTGAL